MSDLTLKMVLRQIKTRAEEKKHVPGARTTPDALLGPVVGGDEARSDDGDGSEKGDKV